MKAAISTDGKFVSAHFGRCPSFTLVETDGARVLKKEIIDNPGHHPGFLPGFLRERGVECIIAGGMGARAQTLFDEHGIRTVMGAAGTIDDVIAALCAGTLTGGESLCRPGAGKGYGVEKTDCDHEESDEDACDRKTTRT
jgi:predicted Fe-Mo cluster-binding NifX family protein